MKKTFTLLLVSMIFAFAVNAQIYVNASATPPGDGTTWGTAYTNLQSALGDANAATEQIWVAAGTYKPTSGIDRFISFNIPDLAQVYGGFDGTETLLTQRNPLLNITTLSGNINNPVSFTDNSYHVVTLIDVTGATIVDGFVVTEGRANRGGGDWDEDNGGGFYIYAQASNCNPTINNCVFTGNYADHQGGGIFVWATNLFTCNPTISTCLISGNSAFNYGGGIYVFGDGGEASPVITSCDIRGNSTLVDGGGIITEGYGAGGSCNASFTSCVISGNEAEYGGGVVLWSSYTGTNNTTMTNCTFAGNNGTLGGGAIENYTYDDYGSDITLINCLFWGNSSIVYNFDLIDPNISFQNCVVEGSPSTAWIDAIGIDGGANIDTNPYFNENIAPSLTTAGDFRNHFASLAIGAGDTNSAPEFDLAGNTFSDPPAIGAFEFAALPGDWDGAIDTDWNNAANWLTGVVAIDIDNVYISEKSTNYPTINEDPATPAECNNLSLLINTELTINATKALTVYSDLDIDPAATFTLLSDVSGGVGSLITNGNVNGEIDANRDMSDGQWHLISIPVTSAQADLFMGDFMQTYNESNTVWADIVDETTFLTPMQGYALYGEPPLATYNFTGTPGNDVTTFSVTALNSIPDSIGWNLVGNPYPSGIDWDAVVLPSEINNAIYYWDPINGNYISYLDGAGVGSPYVPPMQGFFIRAIAAATFSLDNSVRTHNGNDIYYKNASALPVSIVLNAQKGEMTDKTFIRFRNEATADFDGKFDAYKLMGMNPDFPQIYCFAGNDKLSINQLPATEIINLGFRCGTSGTYAISLTEMNDVEGCVMEDLKTGQLTDLSKGLYQFDYTSGENDGRFRIHLSVSSVDTPIATESIRIYSQGKDVFVSSKKMIEKGTLRVTDLSGRSLIDVPVSNETFYRLNTNLKTGVYVVSLTSQTEVLTRKVIIN